MRLHVHAAKNHRAAQVGVFGVQLDLLGHLHRQLTRGQQHQGAYGVAGGRGRSVLVLHHALQQRQGESGCFTGTGLRGSHDVFAFKHHWNGLLLNRRHGFVAHLSDGAG